MSFDRKASLRRIRPQRSSAALRRRPDDELTFATNVPAVGRELLLDTCVYVDVLQGRSPGALDQLLQTRTINHSTIALAEMTHLFGALDPAHPRTASVLKVVGRTIDDIPLHRLSAPSTRAYAEAGMLAGLATRLSGQSRSAALLNDALLFLHAGETGCDLVTANVRDFDWFDQLLPGNGLILYRTIP